MSALQDAIDAIRKLDNVDDLHEIFEVAKMQRTYLGRQTIRKIIIGDTVSYNGRRGRMTGKVVKVKKKNIEVDCGSHGRWNVPAALIDDIQRAA